MTPELTPAVSRALAIAQRCANRFGAEEVEPRHLLLALLQEHEGRSATLLFSQGMDLDRLRQHLGAERLLENANDQITPEEPSPSYRLQHLLREARRIGLELTGESVVASEHLLLAVLHEDAALRSELESLGLDLKELEAAISGPEGPSLPLDEPLHLLEPTEQIDLARILDANANRAREAIRVVEDYCRFVLDDAFLSNQLKQLRHDLAAALADVSNQLLLEARETQQDVGTALTAPSEERRYSLIQVVEVNLKRLQESLRTLEEYGKLRESSLAKTLESLRYRVYTLERAIVLGTTARQRLAGARLYVLVSGAACVASLDWTIKEAIAGGAQVIQLREKSLSDRELLTRARDVRRWTREAGALFIVNDRPDIARLAEADGVHLGQEELRVKDARRILGPSALIGVSTHNLQQARQAILNGAGYLGVGPSFPSGTKQFESLAGLEFVRQVAAETSLPAFAIGGITLKNVGEVVRAGLRRVAVSQAICQADDPQQVARRFRQILDS